MGGEDTNYAQVGDLMPRRVKKRRKIETEDGSDAGWEEYFDYIFPEDEAAKPNLKLLAMAKMWKKNKDDPITETEQSEFNKNHDTVAVDDTNLDADDQDMVNESSSSSSEDDDETSESKSKTKKMKKSRRRKSE